MPMDLFEYVAIPLGLTNAPATFQHLTNLTFQDLLYKCIIVKLDNTLAFSKDVDEHL